MVCQVTSDWGLLFDPYDLIVVFADASWDTNHPQYKRLEAIFKQCRPLSREPRLVTVVIQLLGDKEDKQVAAQIYKLLQSL